MKRCINFCACLLLTVGFSSTAFAADLAVKAPPLAPVPFTWTGCYVGGHLGGAFSERPFGDSTAVTSTGFVGGGQIGCDYQFASNWVVGAEGRAAWSSLDHSYPASLRNILTGVVIPSQLTISNDFLASASARLGYTFADRWLVFIRGGGAWTHEKIDQAFTPVGGVPVNASGANTRTGWTAGTGVDWAFASHWSAIFEYDYYDFGNYSALLSNGAGTTVHMSGLKDRIHAVTIGANYHF